jgi:CubicO group peptidase (beta-lactamase class C family)
MPFPSLIATVLATAPTAVPIAEPPEITWDTIEAVIEAEVKNGFAGAVLLVRDGSIVLDKGYGLADRAAGTPNTHDTIFALGSTPIDFTLVSFLQLVDKGTLNLNDPLSKFFGDIPEDKGSMTLDHIRRSATGLPDFPFRPGVDVDEDHAPLDRDAFIQRFREAKLAFAPGTGDEHSHFAWGVLAAVIEVASGTTYEAYVREHILEPAGMTRTGFNGDAFPGETVAIGYGSRSWGEVNTPPKWGPTSWLVMGSGGMVGTTGDLNRYHESLDRLVPSSVRHLYPDNGVYANGDMYGFETYFSLGGPHRFYVNCNTARMDGYNIGPFAHALISLCTGRPMSRFSIGVALDIDDDDRLIVSEAMPGSPAKIAGLEAGDVLVSCNGVAFDIDAPLEALRPGIEHGTTLAIVIERAGARRTVTLEPKPLDDAPRP